MTDLSTIHKRNVVLMKLSGLSLSHLLSKVSQETALTFRDGPDGWTTLEVLCHLRDFDGYFRHRAQMMLDQDHPELPAYDHEAIAIESAYNEQSLETALAEFEASREITREFFKNLSDEDWTRTGIHPERGHFTMTDAVMQIGLHDLVHLEQITRILKQS